MASPNGCGERNGLPYWGFRWHRVAHRGPVPSCLSRPIARRFCCTPAVDARLTARKEIAKSVEVSPILFPLRRAGLAVGRMDRWGVNLLGRFELRAPDGQEVALGARKSIALLALLAAAPGQRISRDRVAGLLWQDMPDAQARSNLRQLLAATRRLAPFVEADAGSIGFSAGMVETDLAAFEPAIAEDTPAALSGRRGYTGLTYWMAFRCGIATSMTG